MLLAPPLPSIAPQAHERTCVPTLEIEEYMCRLAVVAVQRESALQVGGMLDMFLRVPRELVRKITPKRMLFVGKVDLNKMRTKYNSNAPHSHNPRTNRITIVVEMHGGQTKQDQHQQPKRHDEHHVSFRRTQHGATMTAVKHSTRHAQQQSGKIPNKRLQDRSRTLHCHNSATNFRTPAFSRKTATSHGKDLLRHWLRQDTASSVFVQPSTSQ